MTNAPSPAPCEVRYQSGTSIGYRFRPGLVLTASTDEKLGDPQSVDLGHGEVVSARILASHAGLRGRVSLLAIQEATGSSAGEVALELPVQFTQGTAWRADGASEGYFLRLPDSRGIDFVAKSNTTDDTRLPVGIPVFAGDALVGIAARNRLPPEHWVLTIIRVMVLFFDEDRRKAVSEATGMLLGDQLLALVRSLRANVTHLWSLSELLDHADFKGHLAAPAADSPAPGAESAAQVDPAVSGAATEAQTEAASSADRPRPAETVVLERSARGVWAPVGRPPRPFPLAPKSATAWIIIVSLVAITGLFATAGRFPSGVQSSKSILDSIGR
jgi:hypothetical protein